MNKSSTIPQKRFSFGGRNLAKWVHRCKVYLKADVLTHERSRNVLTLLWPCAAYITDNITVCEFDLIFATL